MNTGDALPSPSCYPGMTIATSTRPPAMPSSLGRVLLLCLLCAACAATHPPDSPALSADAANGQAIATAIGTPFYALFKGTGCLVSAIVVVPSAAAIALTDRSARDEEQKALYAGLGQNCYGSYALAPI
jgi:hypothetical protein